MIKSSELGSRRSLKILYLFLCMCVTVVFSVTDETCRMSRSKEIVKTLYG